MFIYTKIIVIKFVYFVIEYDFHDIIGALSKYTINYYILYIYIKSTFNIIYSSKLYLF